MMKDVLMPRPDPLNVRKKSCLVAKPTYCLSKYSTTVENGILDLRVKCNLKYKEIFLTLANSQPFQKALGKDSKVLINLQSDFLTTFFKYFFVLLKML